MRDEPHSRLFLSCDLTGSTQFKQAEHSPQEPWQKVFLSFYREFPQAVAEAQEDLQTSDLNFELWKPVGDELIFTCLVKSEKEVADGVRTWIRAITRYSDESLSETPMGTKGGAFIGTFPGPDSESSIPKDPKLEKSGADVVELNRQALIADTRSNDYMYDYFGPGIDTGFRILSRCSERYFSLSLEVALAMVLTSSEFSPDKSDYDVGDLKFLESVVLKGVWGGRPYPVFAIDLDGADAVNVALAPFLTTAQGPQSVQKLCEACYEDPAWPTRMYLPAARNGSFTAIPENPFARYKTVPTTGYDSNPATDSDDSSGDSEPQQEAGSGGLADNPPLT